MKKLIPILMVISVLVAGMSVEAQSTSTATSTGVAKTVTHKMPIVVEINNSGHVLLRGTVSAVNSNSLNVKSWGGEWTINVNDNTKLEPKTGLSSFNVGDEVGVQGVVDNNNAWTINANLVRDWSYVQQAVRGLRHNQKEVQRFMKAEMPRIYVGTASAVSSSSLTLTTKKGDSYTVMLNSNAKVLNKNWSAISFSQIQDGNTVRVFGTLSGNIISASVVRDISL
ncbi:MAG: DUF5666 domain-containing protein [Minisyncoccia bacterium]